MSPLIVVRLLAPAAIGAPVGQAAAGAAVVTTLETGATVVEAGVLAGVVAGSVVVALAVVVDAATEVDVAADVVVADEEPSSVQPAAIINANAATVARRVIGRLLLIVPPRLVANPCTSQNSFAGASPSLVALRACLRPKWTKLSISASDGASSFRRPRSTAGSAARTTTARWVRCCCATFGRHGSDPSCRCATTSC